MKANIQRDFFFQSTAINETCKDPFQIANAKRVQTLLRHHVRVIFPLQFTSDRYKLIDTLTITK